MYSTVVVALAECFFFFKQHFKQVLFLLSKSSVLHKYEATRDTATSLKLNCDVHDERTEVEGRVTCYVLRVTWHSPQRIFGDKKMMR